MRRFRLVIVGAVKVVAQVACAAACTRSEEEAKAVLDTGRNTIVSAIPCNSEEQPVLVNYGRLQRLRILSFESNLAYRAKVFVRRTTTAHFGQRAEFLLVQTGGILILIPFDGEIVVRVRAVVTIQR